MGKWHDWWKIQAFIATGLCNTVENASLLLLDHAASGIIINQLSNKSCNPKNKFVDTPDASMSD